ncbi:AEC family transporter [Ectopseudomonas guguanensis]|uniref:AEC family transporter n=1 Tax=Ectopseudomonas guguanensis TaxID=1198456 RepID=UPI0028564484|nr:AEC family transporter [Pseudomonas guguanensis]MDR8017074.1 AEC family transporter [Pseudomonas guguanensis]
MLTVLGITAPIFILIGLGFVSARIALINREQIRGLGAFVINFALPALVLRALVERRLDEVLNWPYLAAYALASLSLFTAGFAVARWLRGQGQSASAILAMGMSVSNSGFIGYPIAVMVLGQTAAVAMALGMLVENLLLIPLALALAEAGTQRGNGGWALLRETGLRLARNPLIIAIAVGLLLSLLQIRLPAVPLRVVDMLANASAPVALFVIGGSLYGLKLGGMGGDLVQTALGKLVLHPLALLLAFLLLPGVEPQLMVAGLLFASAPMMSIYPILGQRFGLEQRCAAALVAATVLAFFSISGLLALLRWQGLLPG